MYFTRRNMFCHFLLCFCTFWCVKRTLSATPRTVDANADTSAGLYNIADDVVSNLIQEKNNTFNLDNRISNEFYSQIINIGNNLTNELKELRTTLNRTVDIFYNNTMKDTLLLIDDKWTMLSHYKSVMENDTGKRIKTTEEAVKSDTESIERKIHGILQNNSSGTDLLTKQRPVVFTALLTADTNITDRKYVVFDREVSNVGHGYNNTTGIFTAPVKGVYLFSAHFLVNKGYVNVQLVRNNEEISKGYGASDNTKGYGASDNIERSGFISAIMDLNCGDVVGLQMIPRWVSGVMRGNMYSSFSGFLLQN